MRELVDRRIEQLLGAPTGDRDAVYNQRSDQCVPLGDEGFLFYAVVSDPPRVVLLRFVTGLE